MSKSRVEPTRVTTIVRSLEPEWDVDSDLRVLADESGLVGIGYAFKDDEPVVWITSDGVADVIAALKAARDWTGE